MEKWISIVSFACMLIWAGILALNYNPLGVSIDTNLAIMGLIAFLCVFTIMSWLSEVRRKAREAGFNEAYEHISRGVDLGKIPVKGRKFFTKVITFGYVDGKKTSLFTIDKTLREVDEAHYRSLVNNQR